MAGATDTARFFIEQFLPELEELERSGLFTTVRIAVDDIPSYQFLCKSNESTHNRAKSPL